jgi:hypothetical protein
METNASRGKGNATNVPERELIEQVRLRPLLYDKNVKDYRKVSFDFFRLFHHFKVFLYSPAPQKPLGKKYQTFSTHPVSPAKRKFQN